MDNTTNTTPVTLESIAQKKAMLLQEIRLQKEIMTGLTQEIFAPLEPATNKANAMMRAFNTGMAVFDGIVFGGKGNEEIQKNIWKKEIEYRIKKEGMAITVIPSFFIRYSLSTFIRTSQATSLLLQAQSSLLGLQLAAGLFRPLVRKLHSSHYQ